MELEKDIAENICGRLRKHDPEITEIVQFGSSVYVPDLARDVDLLVFTRSMKGRNIDYLGCLSGLGLPFEIDLIVKKDGAPLGKLSLGVLGASRVLYGDGSRLKESTKGLDPTFDEAWAALKTAKRYMRYSKEADDALVKDRHRREAFNELSHSARMASLAYLAREELGWGGIRSELPSEYGEEFAEFFEILHVKYFYEGKYPDEPEEEFDRWEKRVEDYMEKMESEV